jgi:polyhydroxyalkanoate synthesis regulator phasin
MLTVGHEEEGKRRKKESNKITELLFRESWKYKDTEQTPRHITCLRRSINSLEKKISI